MERAHDFAHHTEYIQSISVVEYQDECYAVDAWDGGLAFGAILIIPPGLILGIVPALFGIWELHTGWFRPVHIGPPIVGHLSLAVIYVLSGGGSTFGSLGGWIYMVLASVGAGILWQVIGPIERFQERRASGPDAKER